MTAPAPQSQPEITLVQDLRMDAGMLKNGFQKNLTELWHSDVVREAAKNALRAADRIEDLAKALTGMVDMYVALVESGDAGFWDAEKVEEVIAARRALAPSLEDRK